MVSIGVMVIELPGAWRRSTMNTDSPWVGFGTASRAAVRASSSIRSLWPALEAQIFWPLIT